MDAIDRHFRNFKSNVMNIRVPPINTDRVWNSMGGIKIRPLTRNNVLYYYMPLQGLVSYSALSINVMNPRFVARLFPRKDITKFLLFSAFGGASLWLWHRPHVQGTPAGRRFAWVFLGSSMYVLGSILMWAMIRSGVGHRLFISTCLGLGTGTALTYSAVDYFYYLDKDIGFVEDLTEETIPSDEEKYDGDL